MQGSILGRPVYYRIGIGERIAAEQLHCSFQGRVGPKINSWLLLATAAVVFVKYMQLVKKKMNYLLLHIRLTVWFFLTMRMATPAHAEYILRSTMHLHLVSYIGGFGNKSHDRRF